MSSANHVQTLIETNQVDKLRGYVDKNPKTVDNVFAFTYAVGNRPVYMKYTLLQEAVRKNKPDIVEMLLKKGANPDDAGDSGTPPIFYAIYDETCFFILKNAGASLTLQNQSGETLQDVLYENDNGGNDPNPSISDAVRKEIGRPKNSNTTPRSLKLIAPPSGYNYIIIDDTHIGPAIDNTLVRMERDLNTFTKIFGDLSGCVVAINPTFIAGKFYNAEHCILMIADDANIIKGMIIFGRDDDGLNSRFTIFVLCGSDAPRIGSHMIAVVNDLAKQMNIQTIVLESITRAVGFYVKQGFRCSGDGCEMEKNVQDGGHKRRKTRRRKASRKRGINKK